ncbi:MAG: matrixin family metalloprotease, partial [Acidimicrobiales bacterium]
APGASTTGAYSVALTDADGSVVRWNPCQPIRYVVNLQSAPSFVRAELSAAVAAIESASGLDLVDAGTTTERPVKRPLSDPTRYGPGFSPVLISFATSAELPFGSSTASGWGQAVPATDPVTGKRQYVTGQVVLRPDAGWTQGLTSANPLSLMLRHELGHVLGLAHVSATNEIMGTGGNGSARTWGPGDLRGLQVVGRAAGCLSTLG